MKICEIGAELSYAGRRTASNMEGSCEYIEKSHGQPIRGGPPDWGLVEELKTPHRE